MQAPLQLHLGDIVRLRKPHPCGSFEWEIVRVGADIGIRCRQCGRRVLLPRPAFRRRVKSVESVRTPPESAGQSPGQTEES
jgi:hypothetical protein